MSSPSLSSESTIPDVHESVAQDPDAFSDVLVIGGGQAGLSAAYFLQRFGLGDRYQLLDHAPRPGGAWQFRWPTLTLSGTNRVHDLPGYGLAEAVASTAASSRRRRWFPSISRSTRACSGYGCVDPSTYVPSNATAKVSG